MKKLVSHLSEVTSVLMDISGIEPETDARQESGKLSRLELEIEMELEPVGSDSPFMGTTPQPVTAYDPNDEDCIRREAVMSRLCGRWATRGTRGDIEIERRGEHFTLHYLKRNGARTEDRYVLLWYFGEVYYHCPVCRVTVLALDGDTLMISPGVDYTRVVEPEQ